MVNVHEFLSECQMECGVYALATYNGETEPTYFAKHDYEGEPWYLESPCELYVRTEVKGDIDEFAKRYVEGLLEEGTDEEAYIEEYIKPMIFNGVLYEIENFQCGPYLPKEVDDIKIITERECLEYMLENSNVRG